MGHGLLALAKTRDTVKLGMYEYQNIYTNMTTLSISHLYCQIPSRFFSPNTGFPDVKQYHFQRLHSHF